MKNFIDIKELSKSELTSLLDSALQNKKSKTILQNHLNGKSLVLFFEKNLPEQGYRLILQLNNWAAQHQF